jgi:hypothetical protein
MWFRHQLFPSYCHSHNCVCVLVCVFCMCVFLVFLLIPNNILYMPVLQFSVSAFQLFLVIAFLTLLINFQKNN